MSETTPVTSESTPESTAGQTEAVAAGNVNEQVEATPRKRVGRDEFMEVWETVVDELKAGEISGSGIEIVAERTGLKPNTVQQRSTHYRREYGLPLSNMPRGGGARFNTSEASDSLAAIKAKLAEKRAAAAKASGETEADAGGEGDS